uniref:Uncharacterized protein n=1 Tax=Anguilla anguilla TaxID=7936 RepID=A0A0E9U0C8_ANGAN
MFSAGALAHQAKASQCNE